MENIHFQEKLLNPLKSCWDGNQEVRPNIEDVYISMVTIWDGPSGSV
jgi:hypothetical protein